jgi:hypothetical protein
MSEEAARPHRPARFPDLTEMIDAAGGETHGSRAEIAAATAAVLVRAGRSPGDGERFVALADRVGIDTLAALWHDADPVSLPGALWALYLLRQWCRAGGDEVAQLWRAGEHLAPAERVVAGVGEYADIDAVRQTAARAGSGLLPGRCCRPTLTGPGRAVRCGRCGPRRAQRTGGRCAGGRRRALARRHLALTVLATPCTGGVDVHS